MNYKGSCGYVALAMLLSYYDTYFSDSVITEQYDIVSNGNGNDMVARRNSPGVLKDAVSVDYNNYEGFDMGAHEYYNYMLTMQNSSLHAKFITMAAKHGYYDFNDNENPAGSSFNSRLVILKEYLKSRNLSYKIDSCVDADNVREFTINKIQSGVPVLLSVRNSSGGHAVVAYDYDADADIIYCHMGWNAKTTHVSPESSGFSIYNTAMAIDFIGTHCHSNNYKITTVNNNIPSTTSYCYDSPYIEVYNKTHIHSYIAYYEHFGSVTNPYHKAYCSCGDYILANHAYNGVWVSGGQVRGVCYRCQTETVIRTL